jgi:ATP-binding cassette subfamily F protein 3
VAELAVAGVAVEFGRTVLFQDVTFTVERGQRWGIIGRNGSGKTTLINILAGLSEPSRGVVSRATGLRVAVLDQHRDFGDARTVWQAAAGAFAELTALEASLSDQSTRLGELGDAATQADLDRYSHDLERFERDGGYTFTARIDAVLHGLGFDPVKAHTQELSTLSGGERGRLGLACQLAAPADVLVLDEPTNHLDLDTSRWLEGYLRQVDETVLLISHDRAFLEAVVDHVLHLEAKTTFAYTGGYASFVQQREERRMAQARAFTKQSKVIAAESDFIARNIAGQKSTQARGRRRRLTRLPRLSPPPSESDVMALRLEARSRGGDQVLVLDKLELAVEGRTLLKPFSSVLRRGDVLGLIGPNGAGKSTLLRAVAGEWHPESGEAKLGDSIDMAWYRQDMLQIPLGKSLFDIIHDMRPNWTRGQVQGHLGRFDFSGDTVLRFAESLSGGERARLALAMVMLSGANFMIFDEPTNHLDVESIEALEDAIDTFEGTVLLVSHDRALLDTLCTRLWIFRDARMSDYAGTFEEWEESREAKLKTDREAATAVREREKKGGQAGRRAEKETTGGLADRRTEQKNKQSELRAAQRAAEEMEQKVAEAEKRVAALRGKLEDPALYQLPDGHRKATELTEQLEGARADLDLMMDGWSLATEKVERLK